MKIKKLLIKASDFAFSAPKVIKSKNVRKVTPIDDEVKAAIAERNRRMNADPAVRKKISDSQKKRWSEWRKNPIGPRPRWSKKR